MQKNPKNNYLKNICLNNVLEKNYNSFYEIYILIKQNRINKLINKNNNLDLLLLKLNDYINYIKETYIIPTDEFIDVLSYSLDNKHYKYFKGNEEIDYVVFKKISTYNFVNSIKNLQSKNYYISLLKLFLKNKDQKNDEDLEKIEELFIKIVNFSKCNKQVFFIPYDHLEKKDILELEYALEEFYEYNYK